ncbi:MAG: hypothetical protein QMC96_05765 [Methanomicrobiales archaeon]|nr:hypothetical protein [Methanomicrobiales archaeon]
MCFVPVVPGAAKPAICPGQATPITGCRVVDQPGTHVLKRDPRNVDPDAGGSCIDVRTAATIGGRGHALDGVGTGTGISISGMDTPDGSVVRNLALTDRESGIGITSA